MLPVVTGDVFGKMKVAAGEMLPHAQSSAPTSPCRPLPLASTRAYTQIHCWERKTGCFQAENLSKRRLICIKVLLDIRKCVPWLCSVKVNCIRLEQKSTELSICLWQQARGSKYNDTSFDHCPKSQEHAAHALPEPEAQVFVEFKGLQWIILLWTWPVAFWTRLKFHICRLLQWEVPQLSYVMCQKCLLFPVLNLSITGFT